MSCESPLACQFSTEKFANADSLACVTLCFSLAAVRILFLTFVILIMIWFGVSLFGFILFALSVIPIPGYLFPSLGSRYFQP